MDKERNSNNSYVFGLDIGTRSIVGVEIILEYGDLKYGNGTAAPYNACYADGHETTIYIK